MSTRDSTDTELGIQRELHKIENMPPWPRTQGDEWDKASHFVYQVNNLAALRAKTESVADSLNLPRGDFGSYVLHRWYNLQTHDIVLRMAVSHPQVQQEQNPYSHEIDFYFAENPFDLKLTRFPRTFDHSVSYARSHLRQFARWLYTNQSREGRYHGANRLFLVFHDSATPRRTWRLRRDFERVKKALYAFLDEPKFVRIRFQDHRGTDHQPFSGIVFCIKA